MPNHASIGANELLNITEALKKLCPLKTFSVKLQVPQESKSSNKDKVS